MNIINLVRKDLKDFIRYQPSPTLEQISVEVGIPSTEIMKLDSGENPYVEKFQQKNLLANVNFYTYPDPMCIKLRKKIAEYTGMDESWIMCGNGSDELIDLLIRVFVSSEEEIVINPPTFPMYEFYGKLSGVKILSVPRTNDFKVNTKGILRSISAKTKIVFIDSPGNPTSVVTSLSTFEKILKENVIVVSDEAYFEYCGKTVLPLMAKYSNLVVLRTFSKWAGLAGLRIGYAIANPALVIQLLSIKAPYNVNSVAQMIACNVLDNRQKYIEEIKKIKVMRSELIKKLQQFPQLTTYPSEGAYVLLQTKGPATDLQVYLRKNGFLVKLINQPLLQNCIRINIVKHNEINLFITFLRRFYAKVSI